MPTDRSRNLETLFTWNGENTTESVGYEMKKKKKKKKKKTLMLQYLRQLAVSTIPAFFYLEIIGDIYS